jgi:hypothetical protein
MYQLISDAKHTAVSAAYGVPAGIVTEDGVTVITAPASFVELHPSFDGSDAGAATAIRAWAASL